MKNSLRLMSAVLSVSLVLGLPAFKASAQSAVSIKNVLATASIGTNKVLIQKLYASRGYAPAFIANGQPTQAAQDLKNAIMGGIAVHGLHAADYWSPQLDAYLAPTAMMDEATASAAEAAFAKAYVDVAVHISTGRLNPQSISSDIKYARQSLNSSALVSGLGAEGIMPMLTRIAPQHELYQKQLQIMARLLQVKSEGGFVGLAPAKATLRLGVKQPIVADMKKRLIQMGYTLPDTSMVFDQAMVNVIKDVQMNNLTDPTGQMSNGSTSSWEYFANSSDKRIQQVEANLEKLRWLPNQLETRHIFVNLATSHLYVTDPNLAPQFDSLRDMRIINGRPARKTPSMRDETSNVVLNPTWGVPTTVFREDKVPMIRDILNKQGEGGLQDWFSQKRFTVMDQSFTNYIDPLSIDWLNLDPKAANFYIVQQPGWDNALGVAKVMLKNPWSIYMHDTNERELFPNNLRALSSGCMRMSDPRTMIAYLLQSTKWDRYAIDAFVPAGPGETRDKETWVTIPAQNKIALYTLSLPTNLGPDNIIRFTRDMYTQNASILSALKSAGFNK